MREVNASLPRERRLRVLLRDPPVEWERVQTIRDVERRGSREGHAADVIRREVLAKNRRALVVYGDDHLQRRSAHPAPTRSGRRTSLAFSKRVAPRLRRARRDSNGSPSDSTGCAFVGEPEPGPPEWHRSRRCGLRTEPARSRGVSRSPPRFSTCHKAAVTLHCSGNP
jgi:hypothetical protein